MIHLSKASVSPCISFILVKLFNWSKFYLSLKFLASFKINSTFQYNYYFKALKTLLRRGELQKSWRSILSIFHPSREGMKKNMGRNHNKTKQTDQPTNQNPHQPTNQNNPLFFHATLLCWTCFTSTPTLQFQSMTERLTKFRARC